MAFVHGKGTVFKLDNSAASLQDLSAYSPKLDVSRVQELHDVTVFGNNSKNYLPGLKDGDDIPVEFIYDPTVEAQLRGVIALTTGVSQNWQYGPEGSASGKTRYKGTAFIAGYHIASPVNGPATITLTLRKTGDVSNDTWP